MVLIKWKISGHSSVTGIFTNNGDFTKNGAKVFGFFGFEDCLPDFRPMNGFALLPFEETQLLSSTVTGWNQICPWSDPTLAEPNRIRTP
jgi:hypothetical protein